MLRPDTDRLWSFLKTQPALGGFVLIGGSALALRIGHRVSEDLDFAWTEPRLPRKRLEALLHACAEHGFEFRRQDDFAAADEFEIAGMDLHDYQQDFLADEGVKVSFFAVDEPLSRLLSSHPAEATPRIATLEELFASKCLIAASRSKSRDWFDLYTLMLGHGFTMDHFHAAFIEAGVPNSQDNAMQRLCSGKPSRGDEGFEHLAPNPPSLEAMRDFFIAQRDEYERKAAFDAAKNLP